jgi:hypothetical protein
MRVFEVLGAVMITMPSRPKAPIGRARHLAVGLGCVLALFCAALTPVATALAVDRSAAVNVGASVSAQSGAPAAKPIVLATLEQCVTAVEQAERSATFSGEMAAIAGSSHMEMRIDVIERMPGELLYHTVSAPGLGVWRAAAPGVKVYKYLKQVTNLSAPALYRAAVRFRWLNAKGRFLKATELRTAKCEQPAPPATPAPSTPSAG